MPPRRFAGVRFETYLPNPDHPSQGAALARVKEFVAAMGGGEAAGGSSGSGWFRRRGTTARRPPEKGRRGLYLDGGFGVGKTHLLASAWHSAPGPKSILTFEELTAFIGFVGMETAIRSFAGHRLLCIDEFELDDVANTRMAVTFLRAVVERGTAIITTSNAVPDRLGEGRFNAEEFEREISAIASHFDVVRIDGPDYRAASHPPDVDLLAPGEIERLATSSSASMRTARTSVDAFDDLLTHLRTVHPVHYGALVDDLDAVIVTGVHPIESQDQALLFVQLIDEVYDAGITFAATGCHLSELFPASYRRGGYRKKYGRCESRLGALLVEARQ